MMRSYEQNNSTPFRILVVEGIPAQQSVPLELSLEEAGYTVSMARSGREALERFSAESHDLVICDIHIPDMSGLDLCKRIKDSGQGENTTFILQTLLEEPSDAFLSLQAGADILLPKFCAREFLLHKVHLCLSGDSSVTPCESKGEDAAFGDASPTMTRDRQRLLAMVLSGYEAAAEINRELQRVQRELRELNHAVERRVAELGEELRDKSNVMIQQSRMASIGEMVGNIAHQWRQPLNSLGLIMQSLPLMYEQGEMSYEFLASSTSKGMEIINQMSQTLDSFRSYFRPDMEKSIINLGSAVFNTVSLLRESFTTSGISVQVVMDGDPSVPGFANEYAQALLNILLNARDAFKGKNISGAKITISIGSDGAKGVVTISDNAGGIPEEIMERIFDPYFTTKGAQGGTGVGLYMSKAIIETHMGGRLSARNTVDGAEFRIEL